MELIPGGKALPGAMELPADGFCPFIDRYGQFKYAEWPGKIHSDQATTGRFDGENFQVGLTDVCDTPYPETVRALRDIGYRMYGYRSEVRPTAPR